MTQVVQGAPAPPNIVLIVVDDLGWTGLGCYGSDLHETPNIDRLAAHGLRFTDAYAAAPVCSPTRASIQSGKSPARLHITVWYEASGEPEPRMRRAMIPPVTEGNLPLSEKTLAEALRERGYLTAHIGKWHLGDAAHYPENHGFDLNIGGTFWGCPSTYFYPYRGPFGSRKEMRYIPGLAFGKPDEYLTDRLTEEALAVIERASGRPFFINLCYYTVHTPIEGKSALADYYRKKIKPGMDHDNANYAAMHKTLDENVGRVLDKLEQLGVANNTVVVLTSDNGGYVNRWHDQRVTRNTPLRSGKGSLYEGGIRVPLIVRWPGKTRPATTCDQPVVTTDFYPTLCGIAGVPQASRNQGLEGVSLAHLFAETGATLSRDTLFFHYPHYYQTTTPVSAVRAGPWKLLEYHEDGRVELYNLAQDLAERNDLSRAMPDKTTALRQQLHRWREEVGAQMPHPNPDRSS
ncbi:MAG: sulfatase [Pirellulales bacterium]